MSLKNQNLEVKKQNQNELRKLEEFYTTGKLEDTMATINEKKDILIKDMEEYAKNHKFVSKYDRDGKPVDPNKDKDQDEI